MSNNLNAPRVAPTQVNKEQTINDGLGALDGALTGVYIAAYANEETIDEFVFYNNLLHVLETGPTGAWSLYVPAEAPRGLFLVANRSGETVTVGIEEQDDPVVIANGAVTLMLHDGERVLPL